MNKLFPKLPDPRTIIMDICRIHKTPGVKKALSASQHTALFLPPYTPHFNLAEWAFSCIKGHVKKKSSQRYNLAGSEVERDDMEGEDQVKQEEEIGELDEVWKEKEPLYESSSHSSNSSEDEANEEENGDETVLAQPDEVEEEHIWDEYVQGKEE
ncbi:hypothetical protein BG015_003092 [Linnemannia schmuckeri]|uniref:Tc1-like transposase DDE domain-containing protein n=1 Tax=Linnemannia schmuckeri TaxID=64567 RepID=A0A9P5RQG1_9FUNG|nr:hypothetical protein BG015_003092 [Linnemannia schmuckeri]